MITKGHQIRLWVAGELGVEMVNLLKRNEMAVIVMLRFACSDSFEFRTTGLSNNNSKGKQ